MTDPETADQTYIGPMTPELVEQIIAKVTSDARRGLRGVDMPPERCQKAVEKADVHSAALMLI